jgi:hypothetical protein
MKVRLSAVFVFAAMLSACAPYRIEHQHVVLTDEPGLEVLERSKPFEHPPPEKVRRAKYGLPVLATLKRAGYTLTIETPGNQSSPLLFIGARAPSGENLRIEGPYLRSVHPAALEANPELPYTFWNHASEGAPLEFAVLDADGKLVGSERLDYEVVVTGVVWGFDWI